MTVADSVTRTRERRTALINQLRAILLERGIIVPQSRRALERRLPEILAGERNEFSPLMRLAITPSLALRGRAMGAPNAGHGPASA